MALPRLCSSSTVSRSNWNLEMLDFCGGRKTGVPGEKPSEQGREPTTNSAHTWRQLWESNPGPHRWEASAVSIEPQKCTLMRFTNCMIDITRCPLTLILSKTYIILSNMKSYENDKKAVLYKVPKFRVRSISGHKCAPCLFP